MSLTFIGPAGSCELPWIQYALLQDNVEHHLKGTETDAAFSELHHVGDAVGGPSVITSAARLHQELLAAQVLCDWSVEKLAISARTKAVLFDPLADLPVGVDTEALSPLQRLPGISPVSQTLGDVFGTLITMLLQITQGASTTDQLEIIDS